MSIRCPLNSSVSCFFLVLWIFFNFFPGFVFTAVVTLDSIKIYTAHEWLGDKPTVYFQCKGENKTILPDVKNKDVEYAFKGEESWQPLTEFSDTKCKRCGFYEKDTFKSDDVFDEWEFCPSDFSAEGEKYTRKMGKQFDATFLCLKCKSQTSESRMHIGRKKMHVVVIILISVLFSVVTFLGLMVAFKYWQKKRDQDRARFLTLFEDGDDIEDELGLGTVI